MSSERDRLENKIYQHLVQQVSSRTLQPGTFLRPAHLAKNLNVSRTTVRKALAQLVTDGWMLKTQDGYTSPEESPAPLCAAVSETVVLDQTSQIESTYWLIFDWILQGNCTEGDNVVPRIFADHFSISVGTVRHALEWLTQDGVLLRAPRRGWRYRTLTLPDVVDTIEIRTMFETEVIRRAGGRFSSEILTRLMQETTAVLDNFDALSERERRHADYVFHTTLVEQNTSSVLIDVVKPLIRRSMYVGKACPAEKRHQPRSFREHLTILEALMAGNEVAAIQTLTDHLRRALLDSIAGLSHHGL